MGERSARKRARQRTLDRGSDLLGGIRRSEREMDSAGSVPGLQSDRGGGPICPGTKGKPHVRCRGLGKGGCARRSPWRSSASEHRVISSRPYTLQPPGMSVRASRGAAEEQLDGS